ncbi:MAG: PDZ domain-containing protein, partial [Acidobacteriota bacterium]|nr:PDZ domain-containing protein [Acidobacteriota bacterium]
RRPGGVGVTAVVQGSPAEDAGLRARDQVLAVEGAPVFTPDELIARIQKSAPGEWVTLSIQRGRTERDITVRLIEKPDGDKFTIRQGWIGVDAIDLPPSLREHFGAPGDAGIMVYRVHPGSPAESAGLEVGDVLYDIEGEPVYSRGVFVRRIRGGGIGNTLEMTLSRNGAEITVETVVEERPDEELQRLERERIEREEKIKARRKAEMERRSSSSNEELQKSDR